MTHICSEDKLPEELEATYNLVKENWLLDNCQKWIKAPYTDISTYQKVGLCIRSFKADDTAEVKTDQISTHIR